VHAMIERFEQIVQALYAREVRGAQLASGRAGALNRYLSPPRSLNCSRSESILGANSDSALGALSVLPVRALPGTVFNSPIPSTQPLTRLWLGSGASRDGFRGPLDDIRNAKDADFTTPELIFLRFSMFAELDFHF